MMTITAVTNAHGVPTSRAVFSAICPKNRFIAPSSVITLRFPISLQSWADFCLRAGYRDAGLPIKSRLGACPLYAVALRDKWLAGRLDGTIAAVGFRQPTALLGRPWTA